ncbi:MAG: hypothetical protein AAGE94_25570 [Acidobacteriota bacterium]
MSDEGCRPRPHHGALQGLRISLVCGAVYDFIFAAVALLAPGLPEQLLGLRQPGDPYFIWLIAVFLCMLGGFYLFAAYDPRSYRGNIDVAIVGRTLGFVAMGYAAHRDPTLSGLWVLALSDLAFAAAHAWFWLPIRKHGP